MVSYELDQRDLPPLDAAGLLDYDSTTGRVEPGDLSDARLAAFLEIGVESR